jgi:hypothetical protein
MAGLGDTLAAAAAAVEIGAAVLMTIAGTGVYVCMHVVVLFLYLLACKRGVLQKGWDVLCVRPTNASPRLWLFTSRDDDRRGGTHDRGRGRDDDRRRDDRRDYRR